MTYACWADRRMRLIGCRIPQTRGHVSDHHPGKSPLPDIWLKEGERPTRESRIDDRIDVEGVYIIAISLPCTDDAPFYEWDVLDRAPRPQTNTVWVPEDEHATSNVGDGPANANAPAAGRRSGSASRKGSAPRKTVGCGSPTT
jgi:hypothetical protein